MNKVHCHLWTPPILQGFFSVLARWVCSHLSGLFARPLTAGPNGIRGPVPHHRIELMARTVLSGLTGPGFPVLPLPFNHPRNLVVVVQADAGHSQT